jgi:hypothetical protein
VRTSGGANSHTTLALELPARGTPPRAPIMCVPPTTPPALTGVTDEKFMTDCVMGEPRRGGSDMVTDLGDDKPVTAADLGSWVGGLLLALVLRMLGGAGLFDEDMDTCASAAAGP